MFAFSVEMGFKDQNTMDQPDQPTKIIKTDEEWRFNHQNMDYLLFYVYAEADCKAVLSNAGQPF